MQNQWDPKIPENLQQNFQIEKEKAFTLYLDFIIDGSASMYTVFPAVYYAIAHFLETLSKYEIYPKLGMTIFRSEINHEWTEYVEFEHNDLYTRDEALFLKKLKGTKLYGGGNDARESVHTAIRKSLNKFPGAGRNRAIMIFTDAYGSDDYEEYIDFPLGQVVFFSTEELSNEDFRFCFVREDGEEDEEASPMFVDLNLLLKPLSSDLLENIAKPMKDLMKGVSIGG